jgi:sec-independent protein translocase protein TatB
MFDFGFPELVVICVVALLVLGPTRLPGVVRKIGRWVGKARSMAREFREQLESEVNIEELGRDARRQAKEDPPTPPAPADAPTMAAAAAAAATGAATAAADGTTHADAATTATAEPDGIEAMARSGYPYGMPTDTSSTTADPAVESAMGEQGMDDTYSHAHAPGEAPELWTDEAEAATADAAPHAAPEPDKPA